MMETKLNQASMEAKLKQASADVWAYWERRNEGKATDADDPQPAYAKEFFQYFREHPGTPTGKKAGENAFCMWGNLEAADEVKQALPYVPVESDLWHEIFLDLRNAYFGSNRCDEYTTLLMRLEDELTHPKSRSGLLLELGEVLELLGKEQPEKAKACLEQVVALNAHPFDVQKAGLTLHEMSSLNIGQIAPDFTAVTIEDMPVTLSGLRGKVVLLEFWETTCGPCLNEIPHLKTLNEELPDSDFQLIGITQDNDLEILNQFLGENGMTWPQVQQLEEWEGEAIRLDEVLSLYNILRIPRAFLIDRDRTIAAKDLRGAELEEAARKLVAGETA